MTLQGYPVRTGFYDFESLNARKTLECALKVLIADFPNTKFWFPDLFCSKAWHVTTVMSNLPCHIDFIQINLMIRVCN